MGVRLHHPPFPSKFLNSYAQRVIGRTNWKCRDFLSRPELAGVKFKFRSFSVKFKFLPDELNFHCRDKSLAFLFESVLCGVVNKMELLFLISRELSMRRERISQNKAFTSIMKLLVLIEKSELDSFRLFRKIETVY